jgi:hypothetical protein
MMEGWICPVCGNVNAPFVPECPCHGRPKREWQKDTSIRIPSATAEEVKWRIEQARRLLGPKDKRS